MNTPRIIADQGGLVVAEDGPNILLIDRGNSPVEITAFVLLVITLVFGGFGLVTLVITAGTAEMPAALSAGLLGVGILAGAVLALTVRTLRRARRAPLSDFVPVAVFDRQYRTYRDGGGHIVAPLDQVRFERRMQLGSSTPKLVAVTAEGSHLLKRGNPFGGGIGTLDTVLTAAVFSPPQ